MDLSLYGIVFIKPGYKSMCHPLIVWGYVCQGNISKACTANLMQSSLVIAFFLHQVFSSKFCAGAAFVSEQLQAVEPQQKLLCDAVDNNTKTYCQ